MKKLAILLAILLAAACENRYEFNYALTYTVGDQQFTDSGKVITNDPHSVPIAVAYNNSVVVDTYPTRVIKNRTVVVYQGNLPVRIDSLAYSLNQYYRYDKGMSQVYNRTYVTGKTDEQE